MIPIRISIHALRVEGDVGHEGRVGRRRTISIHALRVEGDLRQCAEWILFAGISIHALRVEGDDLEDIERKDHPYFYPRPPGGGRPYFS